MVSTTIFVSTDLLCASHLDTLSGSINTQFLKLCTNLGLGLPASVQDLIKTPWFITKLLLFIPVM